MLLNKKFILLGILIILFSNVAYAQTCEVSQVRSALKKASFDYLTNPSTSQMPLAKIKDLLTFYLNIGSGQTTTDCSVSGVNSNEQIAILVSDALNIPRELPKCSDGTEYGECSTFKPNYCYSGSLLQRCNFCGCPSGTFCSTDTKGKCSVTGKLSLSASPLSVVADGTAISTITATTPDSKSGVIISFASSKADTFSATTCIIGVGGSCSVTVKSSTAGTSTITSTASGYTDGTIGVTFTTPLLLSLSASQLLVVADGTAISTITATTSDSASGISISFSSSRGATDTLSPTTCTTGIDGKCSVTITSSTAGTSTITTTASGYTDGTVGVTFTILIPTLSLSANPTSLVADGKKTSTIIATTPDIKSGVIISFTSSRTTADTLSFSTCTTDASGKCTVTIKSSTAGTSTITGSATGYTSETTTVTFFANANPTAQPITFTGSNTKGSTITLNCAVSDLDAHDNPVNQKLKVKVWAGQCDANDCFATRNWVTQTGVTYFDEALMDAPTTGNIFTKSFKITQDVGTGLAATCRATDSVGAEGTWGDAYPLLSVGCPAASPTFSSITVSPNPAKAGSLVITFIASDTLVSNPNVIIKNKLADSLLGDATFVTKNGLSYTYSFNIIDGNINGRTKIEISGQTDVEPCSIGSTVGEFDIDTQIPSVTVSEPPLIIPTTNDAVIITATGNDVSKDGHQGVLKEIRIFVDGGLKKTCVSSSCTFSSTYSVGTHNYFAEMEDNAGNSGLTGIKSFTVIPPPPLLLSASPLSVVADGKKTSTVSVTTPDAKSDVMVSFTSDKADTFSSSTCTTGVGGSCSVTVKSSTAGTSTITSSASRYTSETTTVDFFANANPTAQTITRLGSKTKGSTIELQCTVDDTDAHDNPVNQKLTVKVWAGECEPNDCLATRSWATATVTDIIYFEGVEMNRPITGNIFTKTLTFNQEVDTGLAATCQATDSVGAKSTWGDAYPLLTVGCPAESPTFNSITASPDPSKAGSLAITFTASDILDSNPNVIIKNKAADSLLGKAKFESKSGLSYTYSFNIIDGNINGRTKIEISGQTDVEPCSIGSTVGEFDIDTQIPSVTVSEPPLIIPTTNDAVIITATGNDVSKDGHQGVLKEIRIFVDGGLKKTCTLSPCEFSSTYSVGIHTYHTEIEDNAGNSARDPNSGTKSFTVKIPPPSITAITNPVPPEGTTRGGTSVTIVGTDFIDPVEVIIGNADLSWTQATNDGGWLPLLGTSALVYDNKMWVLGVTDESGTSGGIGNDVWSSPDGITWTQVTNNAGWKDRYSHTSVVFKNKMWVMGGQGFPDGSRNDVWWSDDGVNWNLATDNAAWSPRYVHSSVAFDNKIWVMGGLTSANVVGEVWWSDDGVNWNLATDNSPMAGIVVPIIVFDNKMWMLNGAGGVWFSNDGISWTQAGNAPWNGFMSSVVYNNKIWVMGGRVPGGGDFSGVWWSDDGIDWNLATDNAAWPPRNLHSSLAFDNKMWVVGGGKVNDIWFSSSTALDVNYVSSSEITAVTPPGTLGAADVVVINPDGGSITLAGGFTYTTPPSLSLSANPTSVLSDGKQTSKITATTLDIKSGVAISFFGNNAWFSAATCTTGVGGSCSVDVKSSVAGTSTITASAISYAPITTTVEFFATASPTAQPITFTGSNTKGSTITLECTVEDTDAFDNPVKDKLTVKAWAGECDVNDCFATRSWATGIGTQYFNRRSMDAPVSGNIFTTTLKINQDIGTGIAATCLAFDSTGSSNWGDAYPLLTVGCPAASPTFSSITASPDPAKAGSLTITFKSSSTLISNPTVTLKNTATDTVLGSATFPSNVGLDYTYSFNVLDGNINGPTKIEVSGQTDADSCSIGSSIAEFNIDTQAPSVSVIHSPLSATTNDPITITATGDDVTENGYQSGLKEIRIFVDNVLRPPCTLSPCEFSSLYSSGTHNYFAEIEDNAGNSARDPISGTKSFTVILPPSLSLSASPLSIVADGKKTSTITATTPDTKSGVIISFASNKADTFSAITCTTGVGGSCSVTVKSSTAGTSTITGSSTGYTSETTTVNFFANANPTAQPITFTGSNQKGSTIELRCTVDDIDAHDSPVNQKLTVKVWAGQCNPNDCLATRSWATGTGITHFNGVLMDAPTTGNVFTKSLTITQDVGTGLAATCQATDSVGAEGTWGDAYPLLTVGCPAESPTFSSITASPDPAKAGSLAITFTASDTLISNPTVTLKNTATDTVLGDATFIFKFGLDYTYSFNVLSTHLNGLTDIAVTGQTSIESCSIGLSIGTFNIDTQAPFVTVSEPPLTTPTTNDAVTITATGNDVSKNGHQSGLKEIRIIVDGALKKTCVTSSCTFLSTYPVGTHNYFAEIEDNAGNSGLTGTKSFTITAPICPVPIFPSDACSVTTNSITLSWNNVAEAIQYTVTKCDANGQNCDTGSTTAVTSQPYTGLTSNTQYTYKVRVSASDETCTVQ